MKIAFATTDGKNVDEHFGRAGKFAIYNLSIQGYEFAELRRFADGLDLSVVETKGLGKLHDARVEEKVNRLSDCRIIYLTEIGGPAAARLIKKGIMPVKVKESVPIE